MKKILILFTVFLATAAGAQKYITRTGEIKFEASMPAFEEVAGTNKSSSCILNAENGELGALCLIKAFKFKSALMEEHFNENYLESSKYPKSTFKGKILNFDKVKLTATKKEYVLEGELSIHGVTQKVKIAIFLSTDGSKIFATSVFTVKAKDYKIDVPSLVKSKISENIKVSFNFVLDKQ